MIERRISPSGDPFYAATADDAEKAREEMGNALRRLLERL